MVWGEYDGPLRTAILSLKHGGHDGLAAALGDRLAALVGQQPWCSEITEITGIPSHPWRRLRRGPPAAFELARTLARQLDRPQRRLLRRRGLGRQMSRRRSQRLALPAETFAPAGRPGRTPLIVDDVVTTGATLDRAARSLLTAGADRVYCAAVARTPDARRVT